MSTANDLRDVRLTTGAEHGLELDVAIVGAGMAGLYTAYRLTNTPGYSAGRVQVFEGSDRIAGRLDSVLLPKLKIRGELGGMRYTDGHEIVKSLIEKVFKDELTPVEFSMGDDAHLFNYLRKQRMLSSAWTDAQKIGEVFKTRYDLNADDLGLNANQLFNKIIYTALAADPWFMEHYADTISHTEGKPDWAINLTNKQWDEVKPRLQWCLGGPLQGQRLNDIGFWNLLSNIASEEGFSFLDAAGGYYSNTMNWNAAEAFPNQVSDFTSAPSFKTIQGGYDLQGYALAQAFLATAGAVIRSQTTLVSFAEQDGGPRRYALRLRNELDDEPWTAWADRIVLAMPRRSLELLDQDAPFFQDADLQRNIQSVLVQPSFKVLMAFETPWWTDEFGAHFGHSVTDLPLRQCYYFGQDPDADDRHSLMLASYNDMRTVSFWEPLAELQPLYEFRPTQLLSSSDLNEAVQDPDVTKYQASQALVDELLRQLRELHGAENPVPEPFAAWYMDWGRDPFGAGYHAWAPSYSVPEVMPYMRHPDPDQAIHVVGEAYSDQQGWVEGALCVAELMLKDHFGLPWPEWLDPNYYLGY